MSVPESDIETQFWDSMREIGITPWEDNFRLKMDGRIHRFAIYGDGKRASNRDGAYFIYADECPNWGIQDWSSSHQMQVFSFNWEQCSLSGDERDEARRLSQTPEALAKREAAEEQRKVEQERQRRQARRIAYKEYERCNFTNAMSHSYLKDRFKIFMYSEGDMNYFHVVNIPGQSQLFTSKTNPSVSNLYVLGINSRGELIIPLINARSGEFQTYQRIFATPNGKAKYGKGFCAGLSTSEACYRIELLGSEDSPIVYLCEGLCTGLAVLVLTSHDRVTYPVFCAMTSHNLYNVAKAIREIYPKRKIILMADNDLKNQKGFEGVNNGLDTAIKAKKLGLVDRVIAAEIPGCEDKNIDWYDVLEARSRRQGANYHEPIQAGKEKE